MAKNKAEGAEAAPITQVSTSAEAQAAAKASDTRAIMLTVDGQQISRRDYIRQRWAQKVDRGTIARELTALQGKEVPYQVVFQATKGIPGGPDKAAPAAPTGEGAASE